MIAFGIRSTIHTTPNLIGQPCSHCGTIMFTQAQAHRYFHIYWIPFFPMGSSRIVQCQHCKKVYEGSELKKYAKLISAQGAPPHVRTPLWHFAGLLAITSLIVVVAIRGKLSMSRIEELSNDPRAGDIYVVDTRFVILASLGGTRVASLAPQARPDMRERPTFNIWRLDSIASEGRMFSSGKFAYKQESEAVEGLEKSSGNIYGGDRVLLPIANIGDLVHSGAIVRIVRQ